MNSSSILSKTGKGMLEASGKSSHLSRADRAVLAQVDGKSHVSDINKKFEKIDEAKFLQLMEQFEKDGFVREISSGPAPAPTPVAARPAPPKAAAPAADPDEELDFTALAAAPKKTAKPPVDLA